MNAFRLVGGILLGAVLAARASAADSAPASDAATSSTAAVAAPQEPAPLVQATTEKVLAILRNPDYKIAEKRKALREEIRSTLLGVADMKAIGVLTLANFRTKFSGEQFQRFIDVFSRLLFSTYIANIEKYTNEKVLILGTYDVPGSRTLVKTKVVSDVKEIPIEYNLSRQGQTWKIYDVHIEGVSLVSNYRSQFREILINKSAQEFLQKLENKVKENEAADNP